MSFPFILGIQTQTTAAAGTGTGKAAQKAGKFPCKFFLQKGLTFFVGFGIIGVLSLLMPCMGEIQKEVY